MPALALLFEDSDDRAFQQPAFRSVPESAIIRAIDRDFSKQPNGLDHLPFRDFPAAKLYNCDCCGPAALTAKVTGDRK